MTDTDLSRTLAPYAYEGVEFPGAETRVAWGHDSAAHKGYLARGQVSETTGRRARVFSVQAIARTTVTVDPAAASHAATAASRSSAPQ